ncbi:MAG TPA: FAD-dependent oxidoreductase [Usitatibacter sp.]|nr:FAD-dependent oxidoreductase [Usitatibacter sp.]
MKRLVLAGGGHAHVEVLRDLAEHPDHDLDVTLVTPYPWLTYSGMVPGLLAGHYELDDCTIDLIALAGRARAHLVLALVSLVSARANELICANGTVLPYDVLSINVGSVPFIGKARGVEKHAVPVRPLERAVKGFNEVLGRARDGRMAAVTVVGAGAAAIEIACAMNHRFQQELFEVATHVRVIGDKPVLVPELPLGARARLRNAMRRRGVEAQLGSAVTEVGEGYIRVDSGLEFATDAVFWVTGATAPPWIAESGIACDDHGFMLTNDLLQSPSHPNILGAGDCVNELGHPLPKAGVFAVRAAPVLAANLRAALAGRPLQPHIPKPRYLSLVSTGDRHAVAAWDGFSASGRWVWRMKDRIDRAWIARYRDPSGTR